MKYICQICGYVYDDAKEKVPFAELPDDWKCPLCGAAKSDFKPEAKYSLQGTTQGRYLTGGVPPVRFSM